MREVLNLAVGVILFAAAGVFAVCGAALAGLWECCWFVLALYITVKLFGCTVTEPVPMPVRVEIINSFNAGEASR